MSRSFWSVMRTWALLGPVAAAAIVATACGGDGSSQAAAAAPPAVIEIGAENVITVAPSSISVGPLVSGELRAQREATVRAEIGGSVVQVVPEEGQAVKQGALLARIEARTQQDAYRSAQSAVRSSEEALQIARARAGAHRASREGRRARGARSRERQERRHLGPRTA